MNLDCEIGHSLIDLKLKSNGCPGLANIFFGNKGDQRVWGWSLIIGKFLCISCCSLWSPNGKASHVFS